MGKSIKAKPKRATVTKIIPEVSAAPSSKKKPFPIVGIGASAGGLEALELFLTAVPKNSGLAFVIVSHLDPNYKGIMVELLQRKTGMPVVQIEDRMEVKPDHVYVIPPNRDLSILHGLLYLLEPTAPRGLRLPIDFFFDSLAEDQQELCVGAILSGMGSDGSQALRTIKEKAGGIFVQDPDSAGFDGMPRSAIATGLVDVVAPVGELPDRIISYLRNVTSRFFSPDAQCKEKDKSGLEKVVLLLRSKLGHDFSQYKKSTMYRRIERRMGLHQLTRISDYVRYLRENPQETTLLFQELLIGVTSFFRDPEAWEQLETEVIPKLLAEHPDGGVLRAWVTGCSTGEEAYSLAILFREVVAQTKESPPYSLQIFATDLDRAAIDKARTGVFPENILTNISEERLRNFFVEDDRGYRLRQEIREMVIFAPQNVIMDPPFTKLDLLTCRNLLIYLEPDIQKKLLKLFHYSLNPNGILFLGSSESIGQNDQLYQPLSGKNRIFRRQSTSSPVDLIGFPAAFAHSRSNLSADPLPTDVSVSVPNLQTLTNSLLLGYFTPAAVLTNNNGDILYISGKTGKYLEPAVGKANLNLFAMARDGLGSLLYDAFFRAVREKSPAVVKGVQVGTNGGRQLVDVNVQPIEEPVALRGMMLVVFTDHPELPNKDAADRGKPAGLDPKLSALSLELQQSREELQTTREEMQSSQEELKSANEELQSTNEELQSTNEELTTSKEEMQSMNEELQTVNQELQAKVDELTLVSDDMKNLLNSTEIATLFLDDGFNVRRFTSAVANIIKLIPGDAGRQITDLACELDYPQLVENAREVLRSLVSHEQQVAAKNDRWFTVRIMPYRTLDNRIDGVVVTFIDITQAKNQELMLSEALAALDCDVESRDKDINRTQLLESAVEKATSVLASLNSEQLKNKTSRGQ